MSDQTTTAIPADVRLFLAAVRRELADVDPEELTEITDGLEADLADLVAERGPSALGDPKAYARELRTAAGISEAKRNRRNGAGIGASISGFLDACHARFDEQVGRLPGDPKPVLDWLRPAWWIVRAAVAALLVSGVLGSSDLVWLLLPVGVPVSILIGLGRIWPGGKRGPGARLVLLGLNVFALAMIPAATEIGSSNAPMSYDEGYQSGYESARNELMGGGSDVPSKGLFFNGKPVTNLYPYDSQGRRMAGVQLFDQDGKPVNATAEAYCLGKGVAQGSTWVEEQPDGTQVCHDELNGGNAPGFVLYPWNNGAAQLRNVFPLAGREQDDLERSPNAFAEPDKPTLGEWPFARVPRVSLPGITSGILDDAPQEEQEPATTP